MPCAPPVTIATLSLRRMALLLRHVVIATRSATGRALIRQPFLVASANCFAEPVGIVRQFSFGGQVGFPHLFSPAVKAEAMVRPVARRSPCLAKPLLQAF